MTTYLIGRVRDPASQCIVIADNSVSRRHCLVKSLGNDEFVVEDLDSTNGTFTRSASGWQRERRAIVGGQDPIKLGNYVTTVAALLASAAQPKLERNIETGEIIKR